MLAANGIISEADRDAIVEGLTEIQEEIEKTFGITESRHVREED